MRKLFWVFRVVMWVWCITNLYRYAFVSHDPKHAVKGVGLAILCAIDYWANLRRLLANTNSADDSSDDKKLVSIIMLNREPLGLNKEQVSRAVERAWGIQVQKGKDATDNFVVGDRAPFMVKAFDGFFTVHDIADSYFGDSESFASIKELRLRSALKEHAAWASVDLTHKFQDDDKRDYYPLIAKLVAELADSRCLALYRPEFRQFTVFDDEVLRMLRSDKPMEPFEYMTQPPILHVEVDDERMKAAASEARGRFPEFEAAFEQRIEGQSFFAKSEFADGSDSEFMWLNVTSIEGGFIFGRLDNEPASVKNVHAGLTVRVEVANLNDWMYTKDGEMIGGFTVKVLGKMEEEEP